MLTRIATILTLSVVALGFVACSSDSGTNTPSTTNSYLVKTTGSYWTYFTYALSGSETAPVDKLTGQDSTVVAGPSTQGGQSCTMYVTHHVDTMALVSTDTSYQREEGGKVYMYQDLSFGALGGLPAMNFGTKWIVMADQNNASWTSFDTTMKGVSFTYNSIPLTADINMVMTGAKIGTETVTVNGMTYTNTLHCSTTIAVTMTITGIGQVKFNIPAHYWLAPNVGMVKMEQPPQTVAIPGSSYPLPGNRSLMIKAVIK